MSNNLIGLCQCIAHSLSWQFWKPQMKKEGEESKVSIVSWSNEYSNPQLTGFHPVTN